jgi:hypothetical protein
VYQFAHDEAYLGTVTFYSCQSAGYAERGQRRLLAEASKSVRYRLLATTFLAAITGKPPALSTLPVVIPPGRSYLVYEGIVLASALV